MRLIFVAVLVNIALITNTVWAQETTQKPADIPIEAFAALPDFSSPKLSPNGEHVGFITSIQGKNAAFFQKLDGTEMLAAPSIEAANIKEFHWATDQRILLIYEFSFNRKQFTGLSTETRLAGVDRDGNNFKWIILPKKVRGYGQSKLHLEYPPAQLQHVIPSLLPHNPDEILVSLDSDQNGKWEIRRVNIHTGKFRQIRAEMRGIQEWTLGPDNGVRLATGYERSEFFGYISQGSGHWKKLEDYNWWKTYSIKGFSENSEIIFVAGPTEHGTQGLFTLNMNTGDIIEQLFAHPKVDVSDLIFAPHSKKVVGVTFIDDLPREFYFEEHLRQIHQNFSLAFPQQSVQLVDRSQTKPIYIFRVSSDKNPGAYYWFNVEKNQIGSIFPARKIIKPELMSTVKSVEIVASDDTIIPSYLTLPQNMNAHKLPTIIMPHGGPLGIRDTAEWDFWTQFIASRGYAVLQPNFRGSGGYGPAFQNEGYKEWGGKMQRDVVDATKWVIEQGISDPDRVCIIGASYGGYAALMGIIKDPDLYACAISVNGVTDIAALKRYDRNTIGGRAWIKSMGLKNTNDKIVSPFHQAEKILAPVLLLSSENDVRVPYKLSQKMHNRLKKLGKKSTFKIIQDGGHHMVTAQSRLTMLRETEKFLAEHIGQ